jgi:arylsulfatase A-like enzyme
MPTDRPNVLWITLEDCSPRLGCYGDEVAETPTIDTLASEGRRYTNAFATASQCSPSRASVLTGMYPTAIRAHHMRTTHTNAETPELPTPYEAVPPHYVSALTEDLRAEGYYCVNPDKTDYQFETPVTAFDSLADDAHWRDRPDDAPFFAAFNIGVTHESGLWPPEDGEEKLTTDPDDIDVPPSLPDTPTVRRSLARQYDNIERADARVGELLRELQADGLAGDTVVVLWSDHGEGRPRAKRWLYDGGIRVPLIVRWPGEIDAHTVSDRLVSMVDLGPTVLSLAGAQIPPHVQGQPFLGPDTSEREYVYASRDRVGESYSMARAVRDRRYKYIRNIDPTSLAGQWIPYRDRHPIMRELRRLDDEGKLTGEQAAFLRGRTRREELYDLHEDPHELRNLADGPTHQETLDRMRTALDSWRDRVGDGGQTSEREMRAQVWPGGDQPTTATPLVFHTGPSGDRHQCGDHTSVDDRTSVVIHCATQGASIAYTTETADDPHWKLYTEPLRIGADTTLRAKAIRYGFEESDERTAEFSVR